MNMLPFNKTESPENAEVEQAELVDMRDSEWEYLPLLVFRNLFQYIDYTTKLQLRVVCTSWLEMVDLECKLSVKVYDDEECRDFIQSIKVKELHIMEWFIPKPKNLLPSRIEGLGLYNGMCPYWFRFNLIKEFQYIKRLTLGGKFLSHLELQNLPAIKGELSSEVNHNSLKPSFVFDFLEKLEIIAGSEAFPLDKRFFSESSTYLTPTRHNIVRSISHDIALNLCYILKNIRSTKRLKSFKIDIYQMTGTHLQQQVNWRFKPLESFLEAHEESLEELLLPNFGGNNQETHSNVDESFLVKNLRNFQIYLCCYMTRNRFGGVQNPLYWLRVLLKQTHLQHLNLECVSFPNQYMDFLMLAVMWKNKDTIKSITLHIIPQEWHDINGKLFFACNNLEILKILKVEDATDLFSANFKNLHKLPASLKILELTGVIIEIPKIYKISNKFVNLQRVVFQVVCADVVHCYQRNITMLSELLNSRNLKHLDIYIEKPPGDISLHLNNVKRFNYTGRLFDECILSSNFMKHSLVSFGIRMILTDEIAKIQYASSICNLNPVQTNVQKCDTEKTCSTVEPTDNADNEGLEQVHYNDDQLIAMIVEDLVLPP